MEAIFLNTQQFVSPITAELIVEKRIDLRAAQISENFYSVNSPNMETVPAMGLRSWLAYIYKLVAQPDRGVEIFTKCNHTAQIRAGATSHSALELMYTWRQLKADFLRR